MEAPATLRAAAAPGLRCVYSLDVDQHAESLSAWQQRYEQLGRGRFNGRLDEVWLDDLQLFRERTNVAMLETGAPWPGAWTLGVPLAMSGPAMHFGHPVDLDSALVVESGRGMYLRTPETFDVVGISIPTEVFAQLAAALGNAEAPAGYDTPVVRIATGPMQALRRRLLDAFDLLANGRLLPASHAARATLRSEVLEGLLATLQHTTHPVAESGTLAAHRRLAEQARALVHASHALPPSVLELCAALGVSRRTLQTCFQQVLGMSPHRYLLDMRLNGLRRGLRAARTEDTVQGLAADWGFWHLSSCAAEYRRLFGELPSATLRRTRETTPASA